MEFIPPLNLNLVVPSSASLSSPTSYQGPIFGGYYGSPITGAGNTSESGGAGFAAAGESQFPVVGLAVAAVLALMFLRGGK